MKVTSTYIPGLKIVQSKIYRDNRGLLKEIFKQKLFKNDDFIFNIVSCSKKNVIRGFHIQTKFKQAKYVSVLKGAILDVALDLRKGSKTFGQLKPSDKLKIDHRAKAFKKIKKFF